MNGWLVFALIALLLYGLWGFFPKLATDHLDTKSILVFQGLGSFAVSIVVLVMMGFRPGTDVRGVSFSFLAGLLGMLGTVFFIMALGSGKVSVIVPMTALYPLVTLVLAVIFLNEKMNWRQGVGIGLALLAVFFLSL